jgi:hypothetical protein
VKLESKQLGILGTVIGAAFFLCIQAWALWRKPALPEEVWILFVAFAVFLAQDRWIAVTRLFAEDEREQRWQKDIEDIKSLRLDERIKHLGGSGQGLTWAAKAMSEGAISIKDIIIRTSKNITYLGNDAHKIYLAQVEEFISKPNTKYVVVGNDHGLNMVSQWASKRLGSDQLVVYFARINFPITNLVIIEYPNKPKEVLFGWDYDNNNLAPVFCTRNPQIVAYFEGLFHCALSYALQVNSMDQWTTPDSSSEMPVQGSTSE